MLSISFKKTGCTALLLLCAASCGSLRRNTGEDVPGAFHRLIAEEWEFELRSSPESATYLGDKRYNFELSDYSPAGQKRIADKNALFLKRFEEIEPAGLSDQDRLSRTLMMRRLQDAIESFQLKSWEMPVDQMNGIHLAWAQLPRATPFQNAQDYRMYLRRLGRIPLAFEQIEQDMQLGMTDRLVAPRYLLERVAAQASEMAEDAPEKSPFAAPLQQFPKGLSALDQSQFHKDILLAVKDEVQPAYRRFAEFVKRECVPQGRVEPGIWSVPNGKAIYRSDVKMMTTTYLTPDQFHSIGLAQVAEIEKEMRQLAAKQGFSDLEKFNRHIKESKEFYAASGDRILSLYRKYVAQMRPKMPQLFLHTPKASLEVEPMETFRASAGVPADYSPGAPDGSRPGRVNVNEFDPAHRLTLNIEAIAYHEGIPGHHQQIALAQELTSLPDFRRNAGYNAYVEGWALYAERLAKEVGFYEDPYSEYGRLENEMWRAVRLVVDTGVHDKHWTRRQMVDYFHAHTAMDEPNIQSEVDRYIAWPGQALAYKAGQIKILELRKRAKEQLGDRFDLKEFHDVVLRNGALPLDVLEAEVAQWLSAKSAK